MSRRIIYPALLTSDWSVVLFERAGCGTVVADVMPRWPNAYPIGSYHKNFAMEKFRPFNGHVTLRMEQAPTLSVLRHEKD